LEEKLKTFKKIKIKPFKKSKTSKKFKKSINSKKSKIIFGSTTHHFFTKL
jgi:hypothetical protein